jgi:GNAT superfamily N-acetyltransferase
MSPIGEAPPALGTVTPIRPTYATRVLPPEEWDKLVGLPFALNGLPDANTTILFVNETSTGEIVGIWGIFLQPVLDGLWVDPHHRHTLVAGQLLRVVKQFLQEQGVAYAFTVISDPAVMTLAHKAGFVRAPGDLWLLQVPPKAEEGS